MFFDNKKGPVFLKEDSQAEKQLQLLKEMEPELNEEGRTLLEQDIRYLEYGIAGERNVAFELKNSNMPMYVLHDLYLEQGEMSAQIDYMVFTPKLCFVIECKNLFGDIEITSDGDFIRTLDGWGKGRRKGIYSPITQNERHLQVIKNLLLSESKGFFAKRNIENGFAGSYRSVVVLANPQTILNSRYAKKEVKQKVIRADQLIAYIRNAEAEWPERGRSDKAMREWAEGFLKCHREKEIAYTGKYDRYKQDTAERNERAGRGADRVAVPVQQAVEELPVYKELRAYRYQMSRKEGIKPYYIYNDAQMKELIARMPGTKEELLNVQGFGPVKADKYGADVLAILERHRR